jgi:hypothetical protein
MNVRLDVEPRHAHLHLALVGAEEENPVEACALLQPDHVDVERTALVEAVRRMFGLMRLTAITRFLSAAPGPGR